MSIATTRPPASGCSPARSAASSACASRRTCVDPVAVRVERRAQPARGLGGGQHDGEVGAPAAAVAHPLHVTAVGVEGHRAADAVEQRVGVAVAVVGARDAVLVVGRPTGSACCRSGTACRRAAAGSGRARTRSTVAAAPRRVARPCGAARRRSPASALRRSGAGARPAPAATRRVGDGDAVAVARLRPGGVRPVGLERRSRSARRRAPTGGRCASSARPPRRAPRGPRRASGARRAGRTWSCRRRASPRRGTRRRRGRGRRAAAAAARRAADGPPATRAAARRRRAAGSIVTSQDGKRRRRVGRRGADGPTIVVAQCRTLQRDPLLRPGLPVGVVGLARRSPRCTGATATSSTGGYVMIGLTENGAVLRAARLHRPSGQARGYRTFRQPRDAVRDRAARAVARHVADVPRRRRHPPARARARVRRVPRAAVRAVHEHARPRGPARRCATAIAWLPGIDADAIIAAATDPETEALFAADRDEARTRRGQPDRVPGQVAPTPTAASATRRRACGSPTRTAHARGRRLPAVRGLRRADRQPRPVARAAARPPRTPPRSSPAFPDGLTTAEVAADHGAGQVRAGPRRGRGRADRAQRRRRRRTALPFGHDALWLPSAPVALAQAA